VPTLVLLLSTLRASLLECDEAVEHAVRGGLPSLLQRLWPVAMSAEERGADRDNSGRSLTCLICYVMAMDGAHVSGMQAL
jgi:hypothetical protein